VELGGKNAFIVFEDANLDDAVAGAIEGGFFNQGEACTAASRLIVARSIHDDFVTRLACAVRRLKVGSGTDPATHVGPLVTRAHQQRVLEFIRIGMTEGARVAAHASLPDDPEIARGFYVAPTLFTNVHANMRIAREEIFGPVACVIPFDTEDEAITIANDSEYGLVAGLYTGDALRANRVARHLDVGVVFVNNYNRAIIGTPFGGTKGSGYGREHAIQTLKEFSRSKAIRTPTGLAEIPRWSAVQEVMT
jgi:acyl-CoA reductase-like NAD-dependent aldehyde dehydrogenase